MSAARATLAHVASRLNTVGTTRILFGRTVEFNGVPVLYVNPSDALVFLSLDGARHLRASDVRRDADAAEIAASVLARVEKAAVCATTERSAA